MAISGILLAALTPDAWAVIILLAVMSLISWFVMISKGLALGRVSAANDDFLESAEKLAAIRSDHDGLPGFDPGAEGRGQLARPSLPAGAARARQAARRGRGDALALRDPAAVGGGDPLGAGCGAGAREPAAQQMDGAPDHRDLGRAVPPAARHGDRRDDHLRRGGGRGRRQHQRDRAGIAAALLATVAGLAVAIPALFGYNYLLSRIEEIDADDQIFVDELEKRIAEICEDNDVLADRARGRVRGQRDESLLEEEGRMTRSTSRRCSISLMCCWSSSSS